MFYAGPSEQHWTYGWTAATSWAASELSAGYAQTEAAGELKSREAKLNGTVYPRGSETHYHFDYGTTTSYGTSTSASSAGAGTNNVQVHTTIYQLLPSTTYHYRVVATYASETTYGADHTFTTEPAAPGVSPSVAAVRNPATGEEWVFYVNSESLVSQWYWNGKTWANSRLGAGGPAVEANSTPSAVYNATNGHIGVYYVGASGHLWSYEWTPETKWTSFEFSGGGPVAAANTTPTAVYNPSNGATGVYYTTASGQMWSYEWTAETSWIAFQLSGGGPAAAEHTSPSAVYNPSNGRTSVYYVATTGQLWTYSWSSETGWIAFQLSGGGPAAAAKTSPTTVYNQSNLRTSVYYVATTGQLWTYSWSSETGWIAFQLSGGGPAAAAGSSPTAVYNESSLATGVYYIASSGQLWSYEWTSSTGWTAFALTGGGPSAAAANTSPYAVYEPSNGVTAVYYINAANNELWQWQWTPATGWLNGSL